MAVGSALNEVRHIKRKKKGGNVFNVYIRSGGTPAYTSRRCHYREHV